MPEPSTDRPVPIPEDDRALLGECRIDTFRAGGPGGQHQNTTESGVRLTHRPTGVVVHAREERSQYRNRKLALSRLRRRLENLNRRRKRRIATRPTQASKERRLSRKRRRSEKKRTRRKPRLDD